MWTHHTILYHATMNVCYTCTVYASYHYHTRSPYMYAFIILSSILFVGVGLLLNGAITYDTVQSVGFIYLMVGLFISVIILLICLQWYKYVYKSYNNRSLKIVPLNINDRQPLSLPKAQPRPLTPRQSQQSKPLLVVKRFELI